MASFCAVCTSERGPFVQRPLGRDDALVTVCRACDSEKLVARGATDRGYEPTGGLLSITDTDHGSRAVLGHEKHERLMRDAHRRSRR